MKYNIDRIQKDFRASKKQKFLFFWGHQKLKNAEIGQTCLSQWWSSEFEIKGIKYFSAEHYMMAEKARLFNDQKNLERIINSKSPGQAKQFGREVTGFKEEIWIQNRFEIVKEGNLAKFDQNESLKEFLLSTKKRILVEASPVDTIWGIGLAKDNEHIENPLKWKGLNLLGFALMEVREQLLK
ncbi:NADAR family protein [Marinifilum flexuosum]|uniref:NADAR domain-containing protein n=1 Tax=Marinifilum flexuosum TaxID=1117708 RepID=A0A419WFB5_9BACT|nr:NADAR family protein [Marinifilum flexuosum]RKD94082.1 hypothetical protein BXY64_4245 [Marinifilum flexuosum]